MANALVTPKSNRISFFSAAFPCFLHERKGNLQISGGSSSVTATPAHHHPQIDPSSSISVPSTTRITTGYEYEAFISFRGSDTHTTFADHWYQVLVCAGICGLMRDDEDLCGGEEIGPELLIETGSQRFPFPYSQEAVLRAMVPQGGCADAELHGNSKATDTAGFL